MPITKDGTGKIIYSPTTDPWNANQTGVHSDNNFAITDENDPTKQIQFDATPLSPNGQVIFRAGASSGTVILTLPTSSGSLGGSGSGAPGSLVFATNEASTPKVLAFESARTLNSIKFRFDTVSGQTAVFVVKKVTAAQYAVGGTSSTGTTLATVTVTPGATYTATSGLAGTTFAVDDCLIITLNTGASGFTTCQVIPAVT